MISRILPLPYLSPAASISRQNTVHTVPWGSSFFFAFAKDLQRTGSSTDCQGPSHLRTIVWLLYVLVLFALLSFPFFSLLIFIFFLDRTHPGKSLSHYLQSTSTSTPPSINPSVFPSAA